MENAIRHVYAKTLCNKAILLMFLYGSERFFLLDRCDKGHKHVFFNTDRYHNADEIIVDFWFVHHMETSMSYSELKIYKTINNTDIDRIKGRLINRIYASEKKRNMNNGLSEIDILDKYFFDFLIKYINIRCYMVDIFSALTLLLPGGCQTAFKSGQLMTWRGMVDGGNEVGFVEGVR